MYTVLKLNNISPLFDSNIGSDYETTSECANPDAIVVRSFKMNEMAFGDKLLVVARAGAGVNNIPLPVLSKLGVTVMNTPGMNANAVKELVLGVMLAASRNVLAANTWTQALKGSPDIAKQVENGKKKFVGREIKGKTLGVVGLGAIGALVANAAVELGMTVYGYDPYLSVNGAIALDSAVKKVEKIEELLEVSDYVTLHVAFVEATRNMIDAQAFAAMKKGAMLINCARGELVDNTAVKAALEDGKLSLYITDFPSDEVLGVEGIITTPHLGASTPEAEDNCAVKAAWEIKDFLDNGNIANSVNYPNLSVKRRGVTRVTVIAENNSNIAADLNAALAPIPVLSLNSATRGDYTYAIADLDGDVGEGVLKGLTGALRVRIIH